MTQTTIKLNKFFYSKKAIDKTIIAFSELINTDIQEDQKYFLIQIQPTKTISEQLTEELKAEFANHCLAETKKEFNKTAFIYI